jgi:hypothetical protein
LSLWEGDRDGKAAAGVDEYALIFGPWASHDTGEVALSGWTNQPDIYIRTVGPDARSQDGKFSSNNCYVLENDSTLSALDFDQDGFTVEVIGIQFYGTSATDDILVKCDNQVNLTVDKCYFALGGDANGTLLALNSETTETNHLTNSILVANGGNCIYIDNTSVTNEIHNCTITGGARGIFNKNGTLNCSNCAIFNNTDDFDNRDVANINYCATDQGAGEGTNGLDISETWDSTCFTDQASGDYSIEVDSPLKDASEITQADDADVPSDDIIGTARNTGAGEQTSIGAYEYVAAPTTTTPAPTTTTPAPTTTTPAPTTTTPAPTTTTPAPTTTTPAPTTTTQPPSECECIAEIETLDDKADQIIILLNQIIAGLS